MTTAHRPTWHTALGGEGQGGTRLAQATTKRSARDQPGELHLKFRSAEQLAASNDTKKFAEELKKKETIHKRMQKKSLLTLSALPEMENPFPEDADDVDTPAATAAKEAEEEEKSESSDDDEERELLRELEKIKQERAEKEAASARKLEEQRKAEQQERMLRANPLLLSEGGPGQEGGEIGPLKRRWDDEVVFKNQAKNTPVAKKHFINDPVRSEFHKKFLNRYID